MSKLQVFLTLLCGTFDNKKQFEELTKKGSQDYPLALHVNTICNDKILDLPEEFKGYFVLEESYYTVKGSTKCMPHLFLITQEQETIVLASYEMPKGYTKETFTYQNLQSIPFSSLEPSQKFVPIVYTFKDGVFEGHSESMFTPVTKFIITERFSSEVLEVSEIMEVNGKRTFGYEPPLRYTRIEKENEIIK